MEYLKTRVKAGTWVAFAGFITVLLGLVAENLGKFEIPAPYNTITLILLTAVISQLTKWLNGKK